MDKPISRGEFDAGRGFLLAFLGVGLFLLSWYFFRLSFAFRYLQIDRFIVAIIFTCLLAFFLIKGISDYKAVDIYRSHLKLKWLWGLITIKVYPGDLTQFGVSNKGICLRKDKTDILLTTRFMNNDSELIEKLAQWRVNRKDNMRFNEFSRLESRLANILIKVIAGVLCIVVFYTSCMKYPDPVSYNSLTKVYGHLSKPPRIDKEIDLTLDEYPSISFHTTMRIAGLRNYQPGTPVTIWISKDAYQRKITQRRFNWDRIEAFEIELDGNKIFTLDKYNKATDELAAKNKGWAFPLILIFLIVFYALRHSPTK